MKLTSLLLLSVILLFQTSCALQPPIDQQTLEEQKADQANKKSDAFARGLAQ